MAGVRTKTHPAWHLPLPSPARQFRPLLCGALALSAAVAVASAQTAPATPPGSDRPALPSRLQYVSALGGYQPYSEQPVQSWREANERVARIGGWRAYAREATTAAPAPETTAPEPHSGQHGGPKR
ncbi:MAG: hypothetical protein RJA36_2623 [Pseudomonadota bacterium]|jgi:hypothetical protein